MFFRLLGPLDVSDGNRHVRLGEGRQRNVLVLLLLHRNEALASDRLIDDLWGESPPVTAAKVVQNYVGRLRRALDDREGRRLQTRGHGYAIRVEDGELDIDRFDRLVGEGGRLLARDRPAEAAARLGEALALWRGPPLADVAYEAFAQTEIARLEEQRAVALERRIDADLALGRHADLLAELEALVAEHPLREHLRGQQMLALYRCGRQAEALEEFREARRLLVEEIGVEPGSELRDLHEAILRQDASLDRAPLALPRELDPGDAPAIVGREREQAWLSEHWERARTGAGDLIALTGEHGMGKTRLAAELAAEVHGQGGAVLFAGEDARSEAVIAAITRASQARHATLLVLDEVVLSSAVLAALAELARALSDRPVLALAIGDEAGDLRSLASDSLALGPLDQVAVRQIALLYVSGETAAKVPAEELLDSSRGVPANIHDVSGAWARSDATRRVVAFAPRAAAGRSELRGAEARLVEGVVDLQAARSRADRAAEPRALVVCPFKGLASFDVVDADYFFGRERLIAELVAKIVGVPLLAVAGPSGSGKSSVVKAGLLPALANGVLPGSDRWPQVVIRPGEHPMRELQSAGIDPGRDAHLVLVVDQFEELFTACRGDHERAAFIDALTPTADAHQDERLVVIAIRADFYGRCASYPTLSRLLAANHVLVGPMEREELRRAIVLPAQRVGLQVEPELEALLADVGDEPGALPLLSTALLELWQQRDGRRLRHATYERTGGVRGAVARSAEDAYASLEPAQRAVARTALLRLASESSGGLIVRRRVPLAEFEGHGGEDLARVLAVLTERRLLTISATTVEVAHEALLREWPRLRGWLEEDAHGRRVHRHLADSAREWDERGRDPSDIYRGARLAGALEWRADHEEALNTTERDFLDASRAAAGRAQRRLRIGFAGVAALLVVAVVAALVAVHQRSAARGEARAAEAQRVGAEAVTEADPARSLLLARQGVALDDVPATRSDLLATLLRDPAAVDIVRGEGNALNSIDLDPRGRTLVVGDNSGNVQFIDALTRGRIGPSVVAGNAVTAVRFSPDGRRVAVIGYRGNGLYDGFFELLEARTHRSLGILASGFDPNTFVIQARTLVFSSDSRVLAADFTPIGAPFVVRRYLMRWDARTGRPLGPPRPITSGPNGALALVGFTNGGRRLVTSSAADGTVIRNAATLAAVRRFPGGGSPAAVSPDERIAALAGRDGSLRLLDLRTGRVETLRAGHQPPVIAMRFTRDARSLVTSASDGRLTLWNVRHASATETFGQPGGKSAQLAIAPDGRTVYTAAQDGSVIGWDLTGTRQLGRRFQLAPPAPTGVLALTANGSSIAVPTKGGNVYVVDSRTGAQVRHVRVGVMASRAHSPMLITITQNGQTLAAGTPDGAVSFVDLRTGQLIGPPNTAYSAPVRALAFSSNGRWLATTGTTPSIYVWDVRRRATVSLDVNLSGAVTSLAVSPDGEKLVATVVHDDGTGELDVLSMPHLAPLTRAAAPAGLQTQFSRTGSVLFYGDTTGRVWMFDTRTWKPLGPPIAGHPDPGRFALSPDDRALATTSNDGTTQLWDTETADPIGTALPGVPNHPVSASFVQDGTRLVTLQDNGLGHVWDVRPQSWSRRACAIAGRTLTRAEWHTALPRYAYAPACTQVH